MSLFKRQSSYSSSYAYTKIDKEDPEEAIHRRAQFLIYKAMDEAERITSQRVRPSFLKLRFSKVKVKIGRRLKCLRRRMSWTISVARAGTYGRMVRQLKACKRLFVAGRQASAARLPPPLLI